MILQALNQYYERLQNDPDQDIAPFGFSRQKISFCVVIENDGSFVSFQPVVSEVVRGRSLPKKLIVPGQAKPPGAGINPCFLWDNATYILGQVPEGRSADWAKQRFDAFRKRHLDAEKEIKDTAFSAVCRFLEKWNPDQLQSHPELAEMATNFGAFRLRGEEGYVHDQPAVLDWWRSQVANQSEGETGCCLVTGEMLPIARLHEPKIQGVAGAQTSGALLISFNLDAFESYGREQSYNAPVSQQAAFQYATALNHLLNEQGRRIQIGDATTVFWTEKPVPEETLIPDFFNSPPSLGEETEDNERLKRLNTFLTCLRKGRPDEHVETPGGRNTVFYLLGLSPNASRISVRFWLVGTLGELNDNLAHHVRDLDICGLDRIPGFHELLCETAPLKRDYPDDEKIPRPLEASLTAAVVRNQPYPAGFYAALLRRIRCEGFIDKNRRKDWKRAMAVRAAAIKTILIRNFGKEINMALDTERPEPAYHLGRWFAILEKTQKEALGENLNATIKDKFYVTASTAPATIFPRLLQLHQHHLKKIENPGWRIKREKEAQEIASRLKSFPKRLNTQEQGLFHLGYYHQTQDFYTPRNNNNDKETSNQ